MATSSSEVLAFTGDDKTAFIKASLAVWVTINGVRQYVGKTKPEKQLAMGYAVAEWWDNTSGVQSLFIVDPDKVDPKLTFSFAQVVDENVLALACNGDVDRVSDPNNNIVKFGSNPGAFREYLWEFVSQARTGRAVTLTAYRGVIIPTGSIGLGTPGQFAEAPMELRFLQDTTRATNNDLGFWKVGKYSAS